MTAKHPQSILVGNALEILKTLKNESIDCVMTSPPYWQLRDYGHKNQLGLEPTFHEYIEKLVLIFNEVKRVLKPHGTCFVNISDTYMSSKNGVTDGKTSYIGNQNIRKRIQVVKSKSLTSIPARFAIAMTEHGWVLRNEIIWHKPNAIPDSTKDRFTNDFEKIYFFTKQSKGYYFNQPKEPRVSTDVSSPRGSKGVLGGVNSGLRKQDCVGKSNYTGFNARYVPSINLMRNKRCVWSINTVPNSIKHFAMYPNEIVETCISSGCKPNGTVLDPFLGSGTTAIVAKSLGFNYVGIEINPEYAKIAEKRLKSVQMSMYSILQNEED